MANESGGSETSPAFGDHTEVNYLPGFLLTGDELGLDEAHHPMLAVFSD
jgi:hypothetical protein